MNEPGEAKGLETTLTMAVVRSSNGKIIAISIIAISSTVVFYWLYRRKKRQNCLVNQIKNDVVLSSKEEMQTERFIQIAGNCMSERAIKVLVERLRNGVKNFEELENILLSLLKTTAFDSNKVC